MVCSLRGAALACGITGAFILAMGLYARSALHNLVRAKLQEQIPMTDESATLYDLWKDPHDVPMYLTYHVYNLTNADDVQFRGAKPNITMLGPITYTEKRKKFNITWNEDRTMVSYFYRRYFNFVSTPCDEITDHETACSALSDETEIVTANIPIASLIIQIQNLNLPEWLDDIVKPLISQVLERLQKEFPGQEKLFLKRKIRDLIFGYDDILVQIIDWLLILVEAATKAHLPLQSTIIQLQANDSLNEQQLPSSVFTGKGDLSKVLTYHAWAGNVQNLTGPEGPLWTGENCPNTPEGIHYRQRANMINGTEAFTFHPFVTTSSRLQVYTEDLKRSADLVFANHTSVRGISTLAFKIADILMKNAKEYPPNCAFDDLGPSGVLNLTAVVGGAVFASKPSFLGADPSYRAGVDGLPPAVEELHDTILDVEPWTGSCMRAHQRLQINAQITQDDKIDAVKHITKNGFYLPLAWADENAMLSPGLAKQWQDQVGLALRATNVLHLLGVIGGSLLCALAIVLGLVEFERNRQASHRRHLTAEGAEQILFHKTGSAEGVSLNRVADESSPLLSHPSLV